MARTRFSVGQVIHHTKCNYRGVIVEAHESFQGTDEWYDEEARSRPPRALPWYRVLVHDASHETYVAERHLELDRSGEPIKHPCVGLFFDRFDGVRYRCERLLN